MRLARLARLSVRMHHHFPEQLFKQRWLLPLQLRSTGMVILKGSITALLSPQSANLRCLALDDDDEFFSDDVASEARARNPATRQEESVGLESSVNVVGSDEVNVKPRLRTRTRS